MTIFGIRPRLAPTLTAVPIVLLCLGLGVWQVQRLHWKLGLIAAREAGLEASPVPPPVSLAAARPLEYHRVAITGTFDNDKEIYLHAISESGRLGYQILTPLREASGQVVFIDRGFVPTALRDPARRAAGQLSGVVHVLGILRLPPDGRPNWFLPDNNAKLDHWFWVDLPAMTAATGLPADRVAPYYLDADKTPNPGGWPLGGIALPELPNHHLQYAITWFALAVAMVVIYVIYHRQPPSGAG